MGNWLIIVFYVIPLFVGIICSITFKGSENDLVDIFLLSFVPLINLGVFIFSFCMLFDGCLDFSKLRIPEFLHFSDPETRSKIKEIKDLQKSEIDAIKAKYKAEIEIEVKKGKKRSILNKLDLTEKDLDELKEMLNERK